MVAASELPIDTGATAVEMAQNIFGSGVVVTGATFSGDNDSSGIYTNGDTVAPGVTPGDTGIILSTGDAEDFTNSSGQSNQSNSTSTNTSGVNNNAQLNAAAGAGTRDAAILDIDFIPTGERHDYEVCLSRLTNTQNIKIPFIRILLAFGLTVHRSTWLLATVIPIPATSMAQTTKTCTTTTPATNSTLRWMALQLR